MYRYWKCDNCKFFVGFDGKDVICGCGTTPIGKTKMNCGASAIAQCKAEELPKPAKSIENGSSKTTEKRLGEYCFTLLSLWH